MPPPSPEPEKKPGKRFANRRIVFGGGLLAIIAVGVLLANIRDDYNGSRAYDYLKQLCELGPRPSDSEAITAAQKLLSEHFTKLGAKVELQKFKAKYPADGPDAKKIGREVSMVNIIVRWNPEAKERIMLCGHYDSLPFPLRDPVNPRGRFVGANDNGSGLAVLMELGNELARHPPKLGVDFVFFDGEEFIFGEDGKYFLGSEYFANDYANKRPAFRYRYAVLLDMVGGADLRLGEEINSLSWDDSHQLVKDIWDAAARLGIHNFINMPGYEVRDDHLALHDIAKIPACDLIDFDYKPWHTQGDTVDKCSAESLAKVGRVLREWLKAQKPQAQ